MPYSAAQKNDHLRWFVKHTEQIKRKLGSRVKTTAFLSSTKIHSLFVSTTLPIFIIVILFAVRFSASPTKLALNLLFI